MSLTSRKSIDIPDGVNIKFNEKEYELEVSGPKGVLKTKLNGAVIYLDGKELKVGIAESKFTKNNINRVLGLYNVLINNYIIGVKNGIKKSLELIGKGYKATSITENIIEFDLGYSHKYLVRIPSDITCNISGDKGKNIIDIIGIDKCLVGEICSIIKSLRKADPYKGKGFRNLGEVIKLKASKKTKK